MALALTIGIGSIVALVAFVWHVIRLSPDG
jgi:hypothetical protein